jgi:prolyl-tRNA editing enzyme YbaK/EbsC (Cys-tRNA(Pro) deacylase)
MCAKRKRGIGSPGLAQRHGSSSKQIQKSLILRWKLTLAFIAMRNSNHLSLKSTFVDQGIVTTKIHSCPKLV